MKVEIDADICGGFGTCVGKAPTVFEVTDDGYAVVLLPDVPEELEAAVQEAVTLCPTRAITIS
jgi:ferredoxin